MRAAGRGDEPHRRRYRALPLLALILGLAACGEEICQECLYEKCTDLRNLCGEDSDCDCVALCIEQEGLTGLDGCMSDCAVDQRPPAFQPLEECLILGCPDEDECDGSKHDPEPASTTSADTGTTDGIGAGDLPDCSFEPMSFDPQGEIIQLESEDKQICARVERRDEGSGSMANTRYTYLEVRVGPLGEVVHIDDPGSLCYFSSHHNFTDFAHAWTGTHHFDIKLRRDGWGGDYTYELHTFSDGPIDPDNCSPLAEGTEPIGGAIDLFPYEG